MRANHTAQIHFTESSAQPCPGILSLKLCTERKPFVKSAPEDTLCLKMEIFPGFQQCVCAPSLPHPPYNTVAFGADLHDSGPTEANCSPDPSVSSAPLLAFQSLLFTPSPAWLPAVVWGAEPSEHSGPLEVVTSHFLFSN